LPSIGTWDCSHMRMADPPIMFERKLAKTACYVLESAELDSSDRDPGIQSRAEAGGDTAARASCPFGFVSELTGVLTSRARSRFLFRRG
jgi:hypothetical protein